MAAGWISEAVEDDLSDSAFPLKVSLSAGSRIKHKVSSQTNLVSNNNSFCVSHTVGHMLYNIIQ